MPVFHLFFHLEIDIFHIQHHCRVPWQQVCIDTLQSSIFSLESSPLKSHCVTDLNGKPTVYSNMHTSICNMHVLCFQENTTEKKDSEKIPLTIQCAHTRRLNNSAVYKKWCGGHNDVMIPTVKPLELTPTSHAYGDFICVCVLILHVNVFVSRHAYASCRG